MKIERSREIVQALEDAGYEVRTAYSGRCMYGKLCIGVDLDYVGEIFKLGQTLTMDEFDDVPVPTTDSMGCGIIAYWPSIPGYRDEIE